MINKEQVEKLAEEAIKELEAPVYVADVLVKSGNVIYVFVDSDEQVHIEDCIVISKYVESKLDREVEDYELNVSSYGATQPLKFPRQYVKNIGRTLEVVKADDAELTGEIVAANDHEVVLKVAGKKKKDEPVQLGIPYNEIKEAKVKVSFK